MVSASIRVESLFERYLTAISKGCRASASSFNDVNSLVLNVKLYQSIYDQAGHDIETCVSQGIVLDVIFINLF